MSLPAKEETKQTNTNPKISTLGLNFKPITTSHTNNLSFWGQEDKTTNEKPQLPQPNKKQPNKKQLKHKFGKNPPKDYQILRTHFINSLEKKGFFATLEPGTPEYNIKFKRADSMFALRHGWRLRVGEMDSASNNNDDDNDAAATATATARTERMFRSFNNNFKKSKAASSPRNGNKNDTTKRSRSMSLPLRPQRQKVFSIMLAETKQTEQKNNDQTTKEEDDLLLPTLLARPDENKRGRSPRNAVIAEPIELTSDTPIVSLVDTDTTIDDSDNSFASSSINTFNKDMKSIQPRPPDDTHEEYNNTNEFNETNHTNHINHTNHTNHTNHINTTIETPTDDIFFSTQSSDTSSFGQKRGTPANSNTTRPIKKTLNNITPLHSFADTSSDSDSNSDSENDGSESDSDSATSSLDDQERRSISGLHQIHPSADKLPGLSVLNTNYISKRESGLFKWKGNTAENRANKELADENNEPTNIKDFLTGRKPTFEWRLGDQIGSGAHGVVYRGLNQQTGALIAVKQIPIDGVTEAQIAIVLQREVDILTDISHPNVVRYFGMEVRGNFLHLMTEYVSGGSIADQLKQFGPMNEGLVKKHTHQILVGLSFLHSHGVVHRDIKGQNVLVSQQGILKLADFGAAQTFDFEQNTGQRHALCGTPAFVAPEIILENGHDDRADIWSLGCTMIQMLCAETPWTPMKFGSLYELLHHVAYGSTFPPCATPVTPTMRNFLNLCFERDKNIRPSARDLLDHPLLHLFDKPMFVTPSHSPKSNNTSPAVKISPSSSLEETPKRSLSSTIEGKTGSPSSLLKEGGEGESDDGMRDEDLIGLNATDFDDDDMDEIEVGYGGCCSCYHQVPSGSASGNGSDGSVVHDVGAKNQKKIKKKKKKKKTIVRVDTTKSDGAQDERRGLRYARGLRAQRSRHGEQSRRCVVQ